LPLLGDGDRDRLELGALHLAEGLDNLRYLRRFAESYGKALAKAGRKKR
jgi:hypothetical protein